ncbi:MAG: hypothetical protein OXC26_08090 [Albidovulum sp.]|nr:hypothetical protein [Albidovulum sp.]
MEAAKAHPLGEVDEMDLRAAACTLAINLVRPQKVVGNLKEGCDGGRLVSMALAQSLTLRSAGNTASSGGRKNSSPRAAARSEISSFPACSSFATLPAPFSSTYQFQKAGQKSNP